MKKIFILSLIILPLFIFGILVFKNQNTNPQKSRAAAPSTPITENSIEINNLTFAWHEIDNTDNLKLIPNFSEKLSSQEILDKYQCNFLSNGPFYSINSEPLGLVISDEKQLGNWQENLFFDGILSINEMATPRITRNIPKDELITAIQVGPILKENNQYQTLKIQNDKESRRVITGVTGSNKLFFLVIYDKNSEYLGPLLANVPNLLKQFEIKTQITFADAINLDGGAASTFQVKNSSVSLLELSPVGAFFCQL